MNYILAKAYYTKNEINHTYEFINTKHYNGESSDALYNIVFDITNNICSSHDAPSPQEVAYQIKRFLDDDNSKLIQTNMTKIKQNRYEALKAGCNDWKYFSYELMRLDEIGSSLNLKNIVSKKIYNILKSLKDSIYAVDDVFYDSITIFTLDEKSFRITNDKIETTDKRHLFAWDTKITIDTLLSINKLIHEGDISKLYKIKNAHYKIINDKSDKIYMYSSYYNADEIKTLKNEKLVAIKSIEGNEIFMLNDSEFNKVLELV